MKSKIKIILYITIVIVFSSCNEESLIEGRVTEDIKVIDLNIDQNANIKSGINSSVSYPIKIDKNDYLLYVDYKYTASSTTFGYYNCRITISPNNNNVALYFSNKTAAGSVIKENVEINEALFSNPYSITSSVFVINGYYTGNILMSPLNWSSIVTNPIYTSPYNSINFNPESNNGFLIFKSIDNSVKGWIKFVIQKDKITIPTLGYRKWGNIYSGNK